MAATNTCPKCGTALAGDAPQGLCPKCLLQRGLNDRSGVQTSAYGAFAAPAPAELAPHFPQLEILELIGQGGMGAVYKARQPSLDRTVALKILPPAAGRDPAFAERFGREARALAKLGHPHIVAVYDFGQAGEFYYFIMEYVDGANLRQIMQPGKLAPKEALQIVPQICGALQYAHDEGVVHRDIKPENILLDKKGRVKIADFGLAKLLQRKPADFTLTAANQVMGTPHYMAPEQMGKPQEVDHRADIYSLGVVIYEMLTGELPVGRFAPPSKRVQVDVRLDEVVLRALEAQPERRYQHISDIKTAVEHIAGSAPGPFVGGAGRPMMQAGAAPMLLLCAIMMVFSGLVIAGGIALVVYASMTQTGGSNEFWGWMGGALGCIIGGLGSLGGCWNTYRQLEGSGDLMQSPDWTWLDNVMLGYGVLGFVSLVVITVGASWFGATTVQALLTLGAMIIFQSGLFLIIRTLMRRAARQAQGRA